MQSTGYFILLLGVLVTVHELGHFLVAKLCGVKVLRFSIGFGPKLFGFTKGETEYQVALLPLGGYVKMAGDVPGEELPPEDAKRGFLAQPPWKRTAIVIAGPAFNLILPVVLFFAVYLAPRQELAAYVGAVTPDLPAAAAGLEPGDRVLAVDGEPVRTFEEMREKFVGRYERPVELTLERDGQRITKRVVPAKLEEKNIIETTRRGTIGVAPASFAVTLGVPEGSSAHAAGLRTFDQVLAVDGKPVPDERALADVLRALPPEGALQVTVRRPEPVRAGAVQLEAPRVLSLSVPRQAGAGYAALGAEPSFAYVAEVEKDTPAARAGLEPGDKLLAVDGKPVQSFLGLQVALEGREGRPFQLRWRSGAQEREATLAQARVTQKDQLGADNETWQLGLVPRVLAGSAEPRYERVTVQDSPGQALGRALRIVPQETKKLVILLGRLVTLQVPSSNLGGPLMIFQLAGKSAEDGMQRFLELMAMISINLGVMNLLPIPILDGFHILAAVWEGVRRRPIPTRAREIANVVGLAMLILLMLVATKNDIVRLLQ